MAEYRDPGHLESFIPSVGGVDDTVLRVPLRRCDASPHDVPGRMVGEESPRIGDRLIGGPNVHPLGPYARRLGGRFRATAERVKRVLRGGHAATGNDAVKAVR